MTDCAFAPKAKLSSKTRSTAMRRKLLAELRAKLQADIYAETHVEDGLKFVFIIV